MDMQRWLLGEWFLRALYAPIPTNDAESDSPTQPDTP